MNSYMNTVYIVSLMLSLHMPISTLLPYMTMQTLNTSQSIDYLAELFFINNDSEKHFLFYEDILPLG